jgi:hypothetical protein
MSVANMKISDQQVKILIDKFVSAEQAKAWREQRIADHKKWKEWIDPGKIDPLPDEELRNRFLEYFNQGAGRHGFNAIYRDRIVRDIKRFRNAMKFLIDESIPIKQRIEGVIDSNGVWHIEGIGKGLATSILMDLDPKKYATWNNKTNMGLDALGRTPKFERGDSSGERYKKVMNIIQGINDLKPDLSFIEIDHFLHIVSAEEEGKEAIKALTEGREVLKPVSESIEELSKEKESMEFAMEKYLEEFIETNFGGINFGANLQLYQDEESNGRQYQTPIGNIDLLAMDKEKKELVVIELKKGRSSDAVVGQILRYMGWVQENLADGLNVRGIIIVKDKDEKLEYALKFSPHVSLFLYEVSFKLKRVS